MTKSPSRRREPLPRIVLADQVKEWLMGEILEGRYQTNARIVETAVAKELGTSQAPVREALRVLEAIGLVEIVPFRGARVCRLDSAELLEAYVVRSTIEVLGARLAVPRMTDDDVQGIIDQGERMYRAADAGDAREVAAADAGLHERIMELSGNSTLLRVWRSLEPASRTYLTLVGPHSDPQWSAHLHDPLIDAVRRRDPEKLVVAIERHFDEVRDWLAERLGAADGVDDRDSPPHVLR